MGGAVGGGLGVKAFDDAGEIVQKTSMKYLVPAVGGGTGELGGNMSAKDKFKSLSRNRRVVPDVGVDEQLDSSAFTPAPHLGDASVEVQPSTVITAVKMADNAEEKYHSLGIVASDSSEQDSEDMTLSKEKVIEMVRWILR